MKLTIKEMNNIIIQANAMLQEHPYLRYGQAVWNALPLDLTREYVGGEHDFFQSNDRSKVNQILVDEFTENPYD